MKFWNNGNKKSVSSCYGARRLRFSLWNRKHESIWDISATNVPYSHYVLRNYIANAKNDFFADNQVRLIIENNAKQNIGILDLVNYDPQHQRAELGIVLLEEYQGKGYAYAAILRLIAYAQKNFHLHQIYAYVDVNNTKSYKCLKSVGFQENACLKDWFLKPTSIMTPM